MSATMNGSSVTRAELAAHIKGIDEKFHSVEQAILRIEKKIDAKSAFWVNAWMLLFVAVAGSAVGTGAWFLFG